MVCTMVDTREIDGTVALATHGFGILTCQFNSVKNILSARDWEIQSFADMKVYPNPGKSTSKMEVEVASILDHNKLVFTWLDPLGRTVGEHLEVNYAIGRKQPNTFYSEQTNKGSVKYDIDTPKSPGIYYLRCQIGNQFITRLVQIQ